jgi:Transposase IS66 family
VPHSGIRLLPRVLGVEARGRVRVPDLGSRQPEVHRRSESLPAQAAPLASASQRLGPVTGDARPAREAERQRLRRRDADPILEQLRAWLDATRPGALPKSALGTAVGYAMNNWAALKRYRDKGYRAIDNVIAPYYTSYVGWRVLGRCFTSGSASLRSA